MTGISPHMSGLYNNRQKMRELLPDAELMPKYFSRYGYWSAGSVKILHYVIDARSWDAYYPAKITEDPFPRTLYPEKRPVSALEHGPNRNSTIVVLWSDHGWHLGEISTGKSTLPGEFARVSL